MKRHHRLLIVAGAALLVALSAALVLSDVVTQGAQESKIFSRTSSPASQENRSLLLLQWAGARSSFRLVDPTSLDDHAGYTPLEPGELQAHALSPDGRSLAAIVKSSESPLGGVLHLIDVPSWTHRPTGVTIETGVSHLSFDSEGKALYWIDEGYEVPASSGRSVVSAQRYLRLESYDLATRERSLVAEFPSWFSPLEVRHLPSSSRIVLYGLQIATGGWPKGPPHVFIVEADRRRVETDLSLGGVRAGQAGPPPRTQEGPWPEFLEPGLGWDLAQGLLYVVQADQDRVSLVDLRKGIVQRSGEMRRERSPLAAVGEWFFPRAEAKEMPGTYRQAVVSPDGSRLYVTGRREEVTQGPDGRLQPRSFALGLKIVLTADFTEVGSMDLPVDHVALSPTGSRMILTGFSYDDSTGQNTWSGMHVADPVKLTVLAHLKPDDLLWVAAFSPHGEYAYLGLDSRLAVLDLVSGRIAAERTGLGYLEALSFLPRGGS